MPRKALWDSWAQRTFCRPLLVGKTPASMTFSEFQRTKQLLIKGERVMKPPEARLKEPVVVIQSLSHIGLFAAVWTAALPSFPVLHHLPELAQAHVHLVDDAIQPCHPLSSPSPAFSLSQRLSSQSIGTSASASVLPMNIQDWFPLGLTGLISLQSKGLSRVFSNTIVQKRQFFGAQPSLWSNSHIHTWLLEKP